MAGPEDEKTKRDTSAIEMDVYQGSEDSESTAAPKVAPLVTIATNESLETLEELIPEALLREDDNRQLKVIDLKQTLGIDEISVAAIKNARKEFMDKHADDLPIFSGKPLPEELKKRIDLFDLAEQIARDPERLKNYNEVINKAEYGYSTQEQFAYTPLEKSNGPIELTELITTPEASQEDVPTVLQDTELKEFNVTSEASLEDIPTVLHDTELKEFNVTSEASLEDVPIYYETEEDTHEKEEEDEATGVSMHKASLEGELSPKPELSPEEAMRLARSGGSSVQQLQAVVPNELVRVGDDGAPFVVDIYETFDIRPEDLDIVAIGRIKRDIARSNREAFMEHNRHGTPLPEDVAELMGIVNATEALLRANPEQLEHYNKLLRGEIALSDEGRLAIESGSSMEETTIPRSLSEGREENTESDGDSPDDLPSKESDVDSRPSSDEKLVFTSEQMPTPSPMDDLDSTSPHSPSYEEEESEYDRSDEEAGYESSLSEEADVGSGPSPGKEKSSRPEQKPRPSPMDDLDHISPHSSSHEEEESEYDYSGEETEYRSSSSEAARDDSGPSPEKESSSHDEERSRRSIRKERRERHAAARESSSDSEDEDILVSKPQRRKKPKADRLRRDEDKENRSERSANVRDTHSSSLRKTRPPASFLSTSESESSYRSTAYDPDIEVNIPSTYQNLNHKADIGTGTEFGRPSEWDWQFNRKIQPSERESKKALLAMDIKDITRKTYETLAKRASPSIYMNYDKNGNASFFQVGTREPISEQQRLEMEIEFEDTFNQLAKEQGKKIDFVDHDKAKNMKRYQEITGEPYRPRAEEEESVHSPRGFGFGGSDTDY